MNYQQSIILHYARMLYCTYLLLPLPSNQHFLCYLLLLHLSQPFYNLLVCNKIYIFFTLQKLQTNPSLNPGSGSRIFLLKFNNKFYCPFFFIHNINLKKYTHLIISPYSSNLTFSSKNGNIGYCFLLLLKNPV